MPEAVKNRIEWIDEFKGFVLLLVCLYHVEQSFANINMGMENLSDFRMSAFFFISGVLFSTRRFPKFRDYCAHKTHVLFFPYVALSLLFLLLDPVVWNFDLFPRAPKMLILTTHPVIHNLKEYIGWNFAKIFVAGKSSIGSGPIWFVFTLFSISLIFYLIQKAARSNKFVIAVFAIASLAGGWIMSRNHIRLPLGIERDLTTLFFFACGYLCKDFIQKLSQFVSGESAKNSRSTQKMQTAKNTAAMRAIKKKKRKDHLWRIFIVSLLTIGSFVLYALIEIPDPNYSVMNNALGKSFPRFIGSFFFGVLGLVGVFQVFSQLPQIAPIRIVKGILRNISRNALIILAVHWWVLLVLREVFKKEMDKPGIAYFAFAIVAAVTTAAIPLFRCKLHKLLGKERISVRESLSIK